MIFGLIFSSVAFIFAGPSGLLHLPDSLLMMGIGQALLGTFVPFTMIPALPEMISSVEKKYKGQKHRINNFSAAIFNTMLGTGQMLAPLWAGALT
jgi:hypothetical protein